MTTRPEHPEDRLLRRIETRWIRRQFAALRHNVATANPHPEQPTTRTP